LKYLFGVYSSKELESQHFLAILDWLKPAKDAEGKYQPSELGMTEARAIERVQLLAEGQSELPLVPAETPSAPESA
jgi:hypothetical protein